MCIQYFLQVLPILFTSVSKDSILESYSTYNLRHCDFVQLQGLRGLLGGDDSGELLQVNKGKPNTTMIQETSIHDKWLICIKISESMQNKGRALAVEQILLP